MVVMMHRSFPIEIDYLSIVWEKGGNNQIKIEIMVLCCSSILLGF